MRTRLGKVVGSQPKNNGPWYTMPDGAGGWYVVAPSGARITRHPNEQEASAECRRQQQLWDIERAAP